jgi:hypothetical protein
VLGIVEDTRRRAAERYTLSSTRILLIAHSGDSGQPFRLKADTRSGRFRTRAGTAPMTFSRS